MNYQLLNQKPKSIFFNLNSLIKDFNIIELNYIESLFVKYEKHKINQDTNLNINNIKLTKENLKYYLGEEVIDQFYKEYNQLLIDNIPKLTLSNEIEKIFQFLQKNNINSLLISDKDNIFTKKVLEKFKLEQYFKEIIFLTENDNIKSYLDKIEFEPINDNIIIIGNTLEDIKLSFKYSLIPILLINDKKGNETLFQNLESLLKIYNNLIRIFDNNEELIKFFENSKKLWKEEIIKITFIGANGNIGKQAINMICSNIPENEIVELVLLGSGSQNSLTRLQGMKKDIKGSLIIQKKNPKVKFTITNDWPKIANSNIIICCAGKWPTEKEIEEFKYKDPSNRLIQSYVNAKMIIELTQKMNNYCPKTLVLIVTNQVDMMCHIARNYSKDLNIIGLSGSVDSTRIKQKIKDVMGIESEGIMIGFHNSTMIPIIKSLKNKDGKNIFPFLSKEIVLDDKEIQKEFEDIEKKKLKDILDITRNMGIIIATEQKAGLDPMKYYGAAILPAMAITKLIDSYCFGNTYIESYNTFISDPNIAKHYGIENNSELSIPLKITKGKIEQLAHIPLLEIEKLSMKEAQNKLNEDLKIILGEEYI